MNNIRFYRYPEETGKFFDARTKDYYLRPVQDNVLIGYGDGRIDTTSGKVSSTLSNQSANKDSMVHVCLDDSMRKELTFRFSIEGYDTFPSVFDGLSLMTELIGSEPNPSDFAYLDSMNMIPLSKNDFDYMVSQSNITLQGTIAGNEYVIPLIPAIIGGEGEYPEGYWAVPFKLELPYTYDAYKLFFGGSKVLSIQMSLTNTDGTIKYTDVRILGNTQNLLYFNPKHDGVSDVMRLFDNSLVGDGLGIHTPQDLRNFKYQVAAETFFTHTETNQEYFLKDSSYV